MKYEIYENVHRDEISSDRPAMTQTYVRDQDWNFVKSHKFAARASWLAGNCHHSSFTSTVSIGVTFWIEGNSKGARQGLRISLGLPETSDGTDRDRQSPVFSEHITKWNMAKCLSTHNVAFIIIYSDSHFTLTFLHVVLKFFCRAFWVLFPLTFSPGIGWRDL